MTYKDIFTLKEYEEDGETKKLWQKVGYIKTTASGGQFMNLPMFPDTAFYIFDNDEELK